MTAQTYRQLILDGINGLPPEILAEIMDFVYFVRKRTLQPRDFETELKLLSRAESTHLEKEFQDYEQRYPRQ
ncbi:MAG: hypothetical protein HY868_25675 [Chloroflexi bacterium]|nr:hypothetical protein [Chloroflexota bacterium]